MNEHIGMSGAVYKDFHLPNPVYARQCLPLPFFCCGVDVALI